MEEKIEPKLLQGFRDLAGIQAAKQLAIIGSLEKTCRLFGYAPLATPALEYAEILLGKYGTESEKLVYKFKDLGEREIALRYDLTVSLARYVAANYRSLTKPFKRYQYGPVWRAEKPQKGRFREFIQFDADVVGSDSVEADTEVIALAYQMLAGLGLDNIKIMINSRKILNALFEKLAIEPAKTSRVLQIIDKLEKIGFEKVALELEKINLSMTQIEGIKQLVSKENPQIDDYKDIAPEESARMSQIMQKLSSYGLDQTKVVFDPSLARGLDYYTGLVFETKIIGAEEFGSIIGGGRYDGLVSLFSDEIVPSTGFSVGVDRLAEALGDKEIAGSSPVADILIAFNENYSGKALSIATALRLAKISAEICFETNDLSKQLKYADTKKIPVVIILGENEAKENIVRFKNMETGVQTNIDLDEQKIITKAKEFLKS